ncbi:ribosome maturation factor RimP [Pediococcus claussenii]|uniref:Ribosome maturation factor RimP n=2 Tax=Pediococcus claussenii TaxID=187452 RepID=G8PDB7_PEDCP|nr:ribosome maturation factor RimP [Pediococcus claussenii]AEV95252.1 Ribosome maturation factor rimP [Pediococcus claussenii ATCC BAA-344]
MSSDVVETVTKMVTPIVNKHNFELVEVEFVKEGQSWFLRVYIDKPGGINIEECAMVSDELSEQLDEADPDPIPQAYFLEVSSPGAERPLKKIEDYENAVGDYIHISLYAPIDKKKVFEGDLISFDGKQITMDYMDKSRKKQLVVDLDKVAFARLAIKF